MTDSRCATQATNRKINKVSSEELKESIGMDKLYNLTFNLRVQARKSISTSGSRLRFMEERLNYVSLFGFSDARSTGGRRSLRLVMHTTKSRLMLNETDICEETD